MNEHYAKYGTPSIKLIEECSELIQAICKADRFGLDDHHPEKQITNRDAINNEINDVQIAIRKFQEWEKSIPLGDVKEVTL